MIQRKQTHAQLTCVFITFCYAGELKQSGKLSMVNHRLSKTL